VTALTSLTRRDGSAAAVDSLERARALVAPALEAAVLRLSPELRPAVNQHLSGGGKYVRAGLVVLSAAAAGADEKVGVVGAVAIELVHNFSLVHDDIIDGDLERRHRPTLWAEHGVGHAIIAGDALSTLALQILLDEPTPERVRAAGRLVEATQAMIAGQAEDMAFEQRPSLSVEDCLHMEAGKTAALLSCAAALGAILAGAPASTVDALADFGRHVGIAFQAVDDVLGIWGEPAVTGKPVGNDLRQHKKTLPIAIALARGAGLPEGLEALLESRLSDADVNEAARLLDQCGARQETMAIGEAHLLAALAALDRGSIAPRPRAELAAVARYVTARDR
jgi:geranylgeranyl diphosphate synthase, type I